MDVEPRPGEVTQLLVDWSAGDAGALDRLLPLVYAELRKIAAARLRAEGRADTLQPTVVVHEAYLRLVDGNRVQWHGRGHFYAIASRAMRQILVDHARARAAAKRGAGARPVALDNVAGEPSPLAPMDVLALEEALARLEAADPQAARVVELRFYGGLTLEEIAAALERSHSTVKRDWRAARAFLHRELGVSTTP